MYFLSQITSFSCKDFVHSYLAVDRIITSMKVRFVSIQET